jgi:hypothetical protein
MGGACSTKGEKKKKKSNSLLVGKPQGKTPLGNPRRMCVDNIKLDFGRIVWGGVDCTSLAQDRNKCRALVNAVMNIRVP